MKSDYVSLTLFDLLLCTVMILIVVLLSHRSRYGLTKSFLWGAVRSAAQLIIVGYLLQWIFYVNSLYLILFILMLQTYIAAWQASRRQKVVFPGSLLYLWVAIAGSSLFFLSFAVLVIIRPNPLWHAPILIPIAGMTIGNALNSAALSSERLSSEFRLRKEAIETALGLGATPWQATWDSRREAMRAAVTPALNQMFVVGIVQLPGMMTGQIIGGVSPTEAVRYQFLVMYLILSACYGTAWLVERLIWRKLGEPSGVFLNESFSHKP